MNWLVIVQYTPITNMPNESFHLNTCWSNNKISDYSRFWKLDYFSEMPYLQIHVLYYKNLDLQVFFFLLHDFMFFLSPSNHISFFCDVKVEYGPRMHFTKHWTRSNWRNLKQNFCIMSVFYHLRKSMYLNNHSDQVTVT